jgi:hypothetical protein
MYKYTDANFQNELYDFESEFLIQTAILNRNHIIINRNERPVELKIRKYATRTKPEMVLTYMLPPGEHPFSTIDDLFEN